MSKNWQAEVLDLLAFHKDKVLIHGKSKSGRPKNGNVKSGWSLRDTAKARGLPVGKVCEDIQIAKALESRPQEIESCADREQALLLSRKREKID